MTTIRYLETFQTETANQQIEVVQEHTNTSQYVFPGSRAETGGDHGISTLQRTRGYAKFFYSITQYWNTLLTLKLCLLMYLSTCMIAAVTLIPISDITACLNQNLWINFITSFSGTSF